MLYLIGIGLNKHGISEEGLIALKTCHKVFLESYTVNLPYEFKGFHNFNKKIIPIDRKEVESNMLLKEAKSRAIALLVYGNPLFATTHTSLILDAAEQGIDTMVIYAASVFDAVTETGLQPYKFGKTASMPSWDSAKKFMPESFIDIIKENQSINAHTLLLCDIGLNFDRALEQLEKSAKNKKLKIEKIVACSKLGTENSEIYYGSIEELKGKEIPLPFCIIIPSKLHFAEERALNKFC